jgi:hypothetical protein
MGNAEVILAYMDGVREDLCDDCISAATGVTPRQTVNQLLGRMAKARTLSRAHGSCSSCDRSKIVNRLPATSTEVPEPRRSTLPLPVDHSRDGLERSNGVTNPILTPAELGEIGKLARRTESVRDLLTAATFAPLQDFVYWFGLLSSVRSAQGNISNDLAYLATLMAKAFLKQRHGVDFDAAAKAQGAPGIDVDVRMPNGQRVVAEIKTTVPYLGTDFGAQQLKSFLADFAKLNAVLADFKYVMVTSESAFEVLRKPKYLAMIPGIRVVCLTTGNECSA